MAAWHTLESARNEWADAPYDEDGGDATLTELLAIAKDAVIAFAPSVDEPLTEIPDGYRRAQLLQARNVWNSNRAGAAGDFDSAGLGLTTFPLDWQVRQLIRPKHAVPVFG